MVVEGRRCNNILAMFTEFLVGIITKNTFAFSEVFGTSKDQKKGLPEQEENLAVTSMSTCN